MSKKDPVGEYLHTTLIPTSSKKRPAYDAAVEVRRMVLNELIEVLRAQGSDPGQLNFHNRGNIVANFIEDKYLEKSEDD